MAAPGERETSKPTANERIEELLDRWEDSRETGEPVSVETLCSGCPELKTEVQRRVDELRKIDGFLEETAVPDETGKQSVTPAEQMVPLPESFGLFQIINEIAAGGMGAVYLARQQTPNRLVALKVIRSGRFSSPREIERFHAEAEAAANLSHGNIVPVFEVGEHDGQHYFTMEYVDGQSLSKVVTDDGPLAPKNAAGLMRTVADAVHYAHQQGVVHRDIKPANILLDGTGRPRITDFGIAKRLEGDTALTATGQILGTPDYMSPEQARGRQQVIGPASDIFSLGATLYALLTGASPFHCDDAYATVRRVIESEPVSPRKINRRIDKDLETIILKCLRKNPAERYASAEELSRDLARYLAGESIAARRTPLAVRGVRWTKRHPAIVITLMVMLGASVWGAFQFAHYVNYQRESVSYFANTVKRWNVLHGIGEVTEEQARRRNLTVRITRRGRLGPVLKVEYITGVLDLHPFTQIRERVSPALVSGQTRYEAVREYEYHADGKVHKEHAYDHTGKRLWSFIFTAEDRGHFLDEHGLPRSTSGSDVVGVKFEFDENGSTVGETFTDFRGNPRPDIDGSFGWVGKVDERGLRVEQVNIGPKGEPTLHKEGFLTTRFEYDESGNLIRKAFFGRDGKPARHKSGLSVRVFEYDEHGNRISVKHFGPEGKPVTTRGGYFEQRDVYNEEGFRLHWTAYDTTGERMVRRDGICRVTAEYNQRGLQTQLRFFDDKLQPTPDQEGAYGHDYVYDDAGRVLKWTYVGPDGSPTIIKYGYAGYDAKYDENGNQTEYAYFDAGGRPTPSVKGYVYLVYEYNEIGKVVDERYLDENRNLVLADFGVARVAREYDERGNEIKTTFFDAENKRTNHRVGNSQSVKEYDESGRPTKFSYFDPQGRPTNSRLGFHSWTIQYDEPGNQINNRHYGIDGKLTVDRFGTAGWDARYDERGRLLEQTHIGTDGKPTRHAEGYSRVVKTYDEQGNQTSARFFDEHGNLVINRAQGAAGWRATFDPRGVRLSFEYFGTDEKPIRSIKGYARIEWVCNARGDVVEEAYFDAKGNRSRDSNAISRLVKEVDNRGNVISARYFDPEDRPMLALSRVHRWKAKYNSQSQWTELVYYGLNDELKERADGYAIVDVDYDRFGRSVKEEYRGADGELTARLGNIAIVRRAYNKFDEMTRESFFDRYDKPTKSPSGYHAVLSEYDRLGQRTKMSYTGLNGELVMYRGYAIQRMKADVYGRVLEQSFYDVHDKPTLHAYHRIHRSVRSFDSRGLQLESCKYGIDGRPTDGSGGFARDVSHYDSAGWTVRTDYFKADGTQVGVVVYVHPAAAAAAARIGLTPGDLLVEYDGKPINDPASLTDRRRQERDDRLRDLVVLRGKERKRLVVKLHPLQQLPQVNFFTVPLSKPSPVGGARHHPVVAKRPKA